VPVQYSYTSTPLSACTVQLYLYSPQYLYSTAIPLLPQWACTRIHFTLTYPDLFIHPFRIYFYDTQLAMQGKQIYF